MLYLFMFGDSFGVAILYAGVFIISIYSLYISVPFALISLVLVLNTNAKRNDYSKKVFFKKRKRYLNLLIIGLSAVSLASVSIVYLNRPNDYISMTEETRDSMSGFMSAVMLIAFVSVVSNIYAIYLRATISIGDDPTKHNLKDSDNKVDELKSRKPIVKGGLIGLAVGFVLAIANTVFVGFPFTAIVSPILTLMELLGVIDRYWGPFGCDGEGCWIVIILIGDFVILFLAPLFGAIIALLWNSGRDRKGLGEESVEIQPEKEYEKDSEEKVKDNEKSIWMQTIISLGLVLLAIGISNVIQDITFLVTFSVLEMMELSIIGKFILLLSMFTMIFSPLIAFYWLAKYGKLGEASIGEKILITMIFLGVFLLTLPYFLEGLSF